MVTLIPGYYRSGHQFRPVVRVMKDGRLVGSKSVRRLYDNASDARAIALSAALHVANANPDFIRVT